MHTSFQYTTAVSAMLFLLKGFGGRTDMHKLCKTLYFADQKHLSLYGRSITGDAYIKMPYGPVPSNVDDILKAVRGDSFFASSVEAEPLKRLFTFENKYFVRALTEPDMDELSETDIDCLNKALELCRDMSFNELTRYSHGLAWNSTSDSCPIAVEDILREVGDDESYVEYISARQKLHAAFL